MIKDGLRASARSVVALMGLAVRYGDEVAIVASGADAQAVVAKLCSLIEGGMGEGVDHAPADVSPSHGPQKTAARPPLAFGSAKSDRRLGGARSCDWTGHLSERS